MPTNQKPRLVILDSHGILFRAFFAFANSSQPPLMSSKGELTFATHGYAETLIRVLDVLKPTHICAAWDAGGPTFRHEAAEEYKATRRPTPPELIVQMARVREMLVAFKIPIYEMKGFEADDVAGTISKMVASEGMETFIATLDTDLVQLVGPHVKLFMFRPYQRDTVEYDEAKVAERWGFSPKYMIDFKSLRGDSSDNVEGIKGIGDKTAADLIRQFGEAEEIFERMDELKPAVRKKLEGQRDQVLRSKNLVTIRTDVPVDFDLDACRLQDYDREAVLSLFRELEFRVLAQRLAEVLGEQSGVAATLEADEAATSYEVVRTEDGLAEMAGHLNDAGAFAVAGLTTAGAATHPLPLGLAFATEPGKAWYVPFGHAPRLDEAAVQLKREAIVAALRPLLEDERLTKTTYGSKYLMHLLDRMGSGFGGNAFDVSIAAFLLGETSSTLNALVGERLGIEMVSAQTLTGTGRKAVSLAEVEMERVAEYGCQQAEMLLRVAPQLDAQLRERGQWDLFWEMEMPLIPVLFRMERWGIALDPSVLRELSRAMTGDIAKAEEEIYAIVGHEFNIASPQQLSDILFKDLGLPKSRKTASGYSTDQRALEALRPVAPIIDLIFEYRGLTKLKSTYLDSLPGTMAADGRVHTDFQQTVAATGRLSSNNPNLQNIPVREDRGREIRQSFVATGFDQPLFVGADYSQIELRVLAHVTGDRGLIDAFLADQDIHKATAATVYGVEPDAVTRQMRDTAKMVNFGIAYGMGEFGLASRTGMTREEAEAFIKSYFANFPGIADWQKEILALTKEKGYAETIFGRRRYLPAIHSSNFQVRSAAEREAINMPIQGTAADIIKLAMIRIDEEMAKRELRSRMILQVHDELIFECPAEEADAVAELATRLMPGERELAVPLKIDVKRGKNWGAMA